MPRHRCTQSSSPSSARAAAASVPSRSRTQVGSLAGTPHQRRSASCRNARASGSVRQPQSDSAARVGALSTRSGSPRKRQRAAAPTRWARRRTLGAVSAASTTSRSSVGPPSCSAMATIAATRARSTLRSSATARSPAGRPDRSRRRSLLMPGRPASQVRTRTTKATATITRANSWEATSSRAASSSSGPAAGSTSTTAVTIDPAHTVATTQSVPHFVHAATASRAAAMKTKASGVLTSKRPRPGNRRFRTTAVAVSPRSSSPRATTSSTTKHAASPRGHGAPAADGSRKGDGDGALAAASASAPDQHHAGHDQAGEGHQDGCPLVPATAVGEDQGGVRGHGGAVVGGEPERRAGRRTATGGRSRVTCGRRRTLAFRATSRVHDLSMLRITAVPPAPAAGRAGLPGRAGRWPRRRAPR